MIVTETFVYIHTSRSAGTFLNKLIMNHVPGARMLQYHGHLRDLPTEYSQLPVIGFVRNPWDWYVSMYFDYRRKQQYVYQVLSGRGALDFKATVRNFLNLGDGSDESQRALQQLRKIAPQVITQQTPRRRALPGLRADHFGGYPDNKGYYSWLVDLMYATDRDHEIIIGRFEDLCNEVLRLFEETGTTITDEIRRYLEESNAMNSSPRPKSHAGAYSAELAELVADKDKSIVSRWGYTFD